MNHSVAEITTERASIYLQQLCKHFAHKLAVVFTPEHGAIPFSMGTCRLEAVGDKLTLRAEAETVVRLSKRYRAMHRSINQDFETQKRSVEKLQKREASLLLKKEAIAVEMGSLRESLAQQESLGLEGFIAEIENARNDLNLALNELSSRISEVHVGSRSTT